MEYCGLIADSAAFTLMAALSTAAEAIASAETHNKKVLFIRMVFDLFICIALRISDLGLKYSNFVIILTNND